MNIAPILIWKHGLDRYFYEKFFKQQLFCLLLSFRYVLSVCVVIVSICVVCNFINILIINITIVNFQYLIYLCFN